MLSEKELLYISDALGQEKHMITKCQNYASQLQDQELKTFVQQLVNRHQQTFGQFYQLL